MLQAPALYITNSLQRPAEGKAKTPKGNQPSRSLPIRSQQRHDDFPLDSAYTETTPDAARRVASPNVARKAQLALRFPI